ncbi:MAG TPA: ABC transporter ATP-binding protein [Dehalococcoidia bacterium]|nr:ABC transporter ATP-binding protein [Dehalococcoidia bacterium]
MTLLSVKDVSLRFGGIVALERVSFDVEQKQICGLIGPNGAGKTTLFNCISGIYVPDEGEILFNGYQLLKLPTHTIVKVGVSRTFQNLALFRSMTVLQNIMVGAHAFGRANFLTSLLPLPGVIKEENQLRQKALDVLELCGLKTLANAYTHSLPYPTLKRIELARAIISEPQLLMLDEPAHGLTHEEVLEFGDFIRSVQQQLGLTLLLVEHHMELVMRVSDKIVVLNSGRKIAEGHPEEIQKNEEVIDAYLGG